MITPGIMLFWIGPKTSISEYFNHPQFLFLLVIWNAYYFVNTNKWLYPGIFLMLLSCFSVEYYPEVIILMLFYFF